MMKKNGINKVCLAWLPHLISLLLICGCNQSDKRFDGVYDVRPFDIWASHSDLYLVIKDGIVFLYGPHGDVFEAGYIDNGRWIVWSEQEVLLTMYSCGITMQILGQNSFMEFPRVDQGQRLIDKYEIHETFPESQFIKLWPNAPILGGELNQRWRDYQKWTAVYTNRGRPKLDEYFSLSAIVSNKVLFLDLKYTYKKPVGIVFNPTNFHGRVVVLTDDGKGTIIDLRTKEETPAVLVQPDQQFHYRIDLNPYFESSKDLSSTIIYSELEFIMPTHTVVRSKWVKVAEKEAELPSSQKKWEFP